jgi:ribonucleoside-diphosphate reductase alpha chain
MGAGYNLNTAADPVHSLLRLNEHAARVEASGLCERYIGNIAHISVNHPRVKDFIQAKICHQGIVHFNTSIDLTDDFMGAVLNQMTPSSTSGGRMPASELWSEIIKCAWACGDPGIISLARYGSGNPLRDISPYETVAPCAEVGLAPGESCVFGYINLAACLQPGSLDLDLELIGSVAECLTRVLDDALEASIDGYPNDVSNAVMASNRKIGIGICGYADMLMWKGVDYGSRKSIESLTAALAMINFRSKLASLSLAARRGPFPHFYFSRLVSEPGFISRFGAFSGAAIPQSEWNKLESTVANHGLRNSMTTALPPSGRSSRLIGANPSLEPYLTISHNGEHPLPIRILLEQGFVSTTTNGGLMTTYQDSQSWPEQARNKNSLFRCATEIDFKDHLATLEVASRLVDDGVSKTINLPASASVAAVDTVYKAAWSAGLKAISVYRSSFESAEA